MAIKPEDTPNQQPADTIPSVKPGTPALPAEYENATLLLLSVKVVPTPGDTTWVIDEAEAKGAHVVRRKLASETETHIYRVFSDKPGRVTFRSFFSQPSSDENQALTVSYVFVDGTTGALSDAQPNVGSSVAHGDFGPDDLDIQAGKPVYYFGIELIDGNSLPQEPYTFVVLEV